MEDLEHKNSSIHNLQGEKDEDGANINDRPNEILLLILHRLEDAKCLCRCYLVSKRFASLIPNIHNVIFSVPNRDSHSHSDSDSYSNLSVPDGEREKNFPKNVINLLVNNLVTKPFRYLRQIASGPSIPSPSSSCPAFDSVAFLSCVRFLKKFRELERVEIQIPCFHARDPSLLKWEAGVGKDSIFCVTLFSSSSHERLAENIIEEGNAPFALTNELLRDRVEMAYQCFMDALWRRHVLRHVVMDHRTLQEVRFTDQKGNGTVRLRTKQVANLQDLRAAGAGYMKVWHVPEVLTPRTGRVMRGVTAVLIGVSEDERGGGGGGDGWMEEVFKEDEVLGEALKIIYDSRRDDALAVTLDLNIPH